jgi:hypothetical protein
MKGSRKDQFHGAKFRICCNSPGHADVYIYQGRIPDVGAPMALPVSQNRDIVL